LSQYVLRASIRVQESRGRVDGALMSLTPRISRPTRAILILSIVLGCALAGSAQASASRSGCAQASASAASVGAGVAGRAVRCLVNAQRTAHGLRPVKAARHLRLSAQRHAADMVARHYFEHVSPEGSTLTQRARRAGYLSGARRYSLGENIGWGERQLASATSIVQAWMKSPGHRAIILDRRFDEAGVGIAAGVPAAGSGAPGATFVLNVGTRA
jgi:hypothetical protein